MPNGRTYHWRAWTTFLAGWAALAAGCCCARPAVPLPPEGSVPRELSMTALPPYVIAPPDILTVEVRETKDGIPPEARPLDIQPIEGPHIVRMDGTIHLGVWGSVQVAGLTLDQAAQAVRYTVAQLKGYNPAKLLVVMDVAAYNSKKYYVITDGAGYGEQVFPFPITGGETVLDAIGNINGLPVVASKRNIWVARRSPGCNPEQILPVNWVGITQHGDVTTNYQVLPGDRVYVKAEQIQRIPNELDKWLRPVEKVLGVTLLGSQTVNSIKGQTGSTTP
jgi:polysaccharide biosynthesis/export protein